MVVACGQSTLNDDPAAVQQGSDTEESTSTLEPSDIETFDAMLEAEFLRSLAGKDPAKLDLSPCALREIVLVDFVASLAVEHVSLPAIVDEVERQFLERKRWRDRLGGSTRERDMQSLANVATVLRDRLEGSDGCDKKATIVDKRGSSIECEVPAEALERLHRIEMTL